MYCVMRASMPSLCNVYRRYDFSSKGYAMDVLEVYIHELKLHAAMTPCDCTLKNFVLQDLFSETGTLKVCISFSYKCMHDPDAFMSLAAKWVCICFPMCKIIQRRNRISFLVFM